MPNFLRSHHFRTKWHRQGSYCLEFASAAIAPPHSLQVYPTAEWLPRQGVQRGSIFEGMDSTWTPLLADTACVFHTGTLAPADGQGLGTR